MEYKISELVAKTNIPKSKILYYIREGLLPEAKKIKSNVHRYSDEHLKLIEYIKYMKEEMNCSNAQIKASLENKNSSFSSSYTMLVPLMNTLCAIEEGTKYYSKKEFVDIFDIDIDLLDELLEMKIILPINDKSFTSKDASIISLVKHFKNVGIDYNILKEYVLYAKKLSQLELEMQQSLCSVRDDDNFATLWKIMFETLFNAKGYIFNRSTYKVLSKALKDEMVEKD
jgi:DNA-binding transcriptional MerR regulator